MTTAVFDCMVFVQAAINEQGPAAACLSLVETGQVTLYCSPPILAEVQNVLSRPKFRAKFPHLTDERVELFLEKIGQTATMIQDVPPLIAFPRDPKDEPYLDLVARSKPSHLVSRNNDLLDLRTDREFLKQLPGVTILDPVEFLNVVRDIP